MINRRNFFAAAGGASILARAAARQPNIVFILADDLGSADLGCYGQQKIRTPNIDTLAAAGTRFTDCYAGGAVCAPSRSVLMSGLHGGHAPIRANAGTEPIRADDLTVAQVLKGAGYATGGFGKWGLGDVRSTGTPSRHGFDDFFGYLHQVHAHSYYPEFLWDNERKFALPKGAYSADVIFERSLDFVRRNRARPFFLYECTTLPHAKFEPPDLKPYDSQPWTPGQKAYAAMVTRLDAQVGRLLALLAELKLERDTLVCFASDNGAHSGEDKGYELFRSNGQLRGEKGQLYEGGIRVPMIARWPGQIKTGAVSHVPWAFCDVMPTLAEVARAKAPAGLDGVSMLPTLLGAKAPRREYLYWESNLWNAKTKQLQEARFSQAVRMGDWKAIRPAAGKPLELYNLAQDAGETKNVAAENAAVVERAEAIFKSAHTTPRPHTIGDMQFAR